MTNTPRITTAEVRAALELAAKADPPPWAALRLLEKGYTRENARFIAKARTLVPRLAADLIDARAREHELQILAATLLSALRSAHDAYVIADCGGIESRASWDALETWIEERNPMTASRFLIGKNANAVN